MRRKLDNKTKADIRYEVYLNERVRNIESKAKHAEMFDKYILTLAGGAFGISITFVDKIAKYIDKNTIFWLAIAWGMFALSMLSTLMSFRCGAKAFEKQIEVLDCNYENDKNDDIPENLVQEIKSLNQLSILSFIIGVISLIIFSLLNI